jgi:hypothetical protein
MHATINKGNLFSAIHRRLAVNLVTINSQPHIPDLSQMNKP